MFASSRAWIVLSVLVLVPVLGSGCSLDKVGLLRGRGDAAGLDAATGDAGVRDSGPNDSSTPACDSAVACGCAPGSVRSVSCPMCGLQAQRCTADGTWIDEGVCTGAGDCMPDAVETGAACGMCGAMTRTCSAACTWNAWSCLGESGECMAGAVETGMQACECDGTQPIARTCDAACAWGAWGASGTCTMPGTGVCVPGTTETERQSCGTTGCGTQRRTRTCNAASCTWDPWTPYGMCMGDIGCWAPMASVWRCVGATGGGWTCCADGHWSDRGC